MIVREVLVLVSCAALTSGCSGEFQCDRASKNETLWCPESEVCLTNAGSEWVKPDSGAYDYACPEDASEARCDGYNNDADSTERGQVWAWNAETERCEDVS